VHEPFDIKITSMFSKEDMKRGFAYFAEGVHDYSLRIFWPILLFHLTLNFKQLGGVYTLSNAVLAIFTIYVGKKITSKNKRKILHIGAITHSLTVFVRTTLKTLSLIAIVQSFGALTWSLINIPFQSMFYNSSKSKGITHMIFVREFYLHIGRLLTIILAAIFLFFFEIKLALIIIILTGGVFTWLMTFIQEE